MRCPVAWWRERGGAAQRPETALFVMGIMSELTRAAEGAVWPNRAHESLSRVRERLGRLTDVDAALLCAAWLDEFTAGRPPVFALDAMCVAWLMAREGVAPPVD